MLTKTIAIGLLSSCFVFTTMAQDSITGSWTGRVENSIRVHLKINDPQTGSAKVLFPMLSMESDANLNVSESGDSILLDFKLVTSAITIYGVRAGDETIKAQWSQNNQTKPIELTRIDSISPPYRSQFPLQPYDYLEQELSFYNSKDDFTLAGTLTLPDDRKDHPVVILISGSGLQNRNSEVLGHKSFLILADHLTRQGIGVFRYDERGAGKSEGSYFDATSEDFKEDVLAAVRKLDSLGYANIGLIGHSEGGMIAPMAAVEDERVDFVVSLAGPGVPIAELMVIQNENVLRDQEFPEEDLSDYLQFLREAYAIVDVTTLKDSLYGPIQELCNDFYNSRDSEVQQQLAPSAQLFYMQLAGAYLGDWFRYFINVNPSNYLEKLSCPVLALNGKMDIQVSAAENIEAYNDHLSHSKAPFFKCKALDSINHMFQKVDHWNTYEYYESAETFNVEVMDMIVEWISELDL